jgi:hypothetical protein
MRDMSWHRAIIEAFETMFWPDTDVMRLVGPAPMGGEFIELVMDEAPLRRAMVDFSVRILILSLPASRARAPRRELDRAVGNGEPEGRPDGAFDEADLAAVGAHELGRNRKAEPGAAGAGRALERLERASTDCISRAGALGGRACGFLARAGTLGFATWHPVFCGTAELRNERQSSARADLSPGRQNREEGPDAPPGPFV